LIASPLDLSQNSAALCVVAETCTGSFDDDRLDLPASHVRQDAVVKFDRER
jgi:hypothetical protein